ncbi:hypothetical protein CNMCM8980_004876 [Aspergillus fumigatiaffinis]|nr:hypothetical protein CNMCM8980_004876 [Aspergillus fumigatiaffinis]
MESVLELMANTKPVSYAVAAEEPEQSALKSTTLQAAPTFPRFSTHVKVFLLSTGGDRSGICQLRGLIRTIHSTGSDSRGINVDMQINRNWSGENNGLGTILGEMKTTSVGGPANFTGYLYEIGDNNVGNRIMLNQSIDWTTANQDWANGNAWWIKSWNTADTNYVCHIWWQVFKE